MKSSEEALGSWRGWVGGEQVGGCFPPAWWIVGLYNPLSHLPPVRFRESFPVDAGKCSVFVFCDTLKPNFPIIVYPEQNWILGSGVRWCHLWVWFNTDGGNRFMSAVLVVNTRTTSGLFIFPRSNFFFRKILKKEIWLFRVGTAPPAAGSLRGEWWGGKSRSVSWSTSAITGCSCRSCSGL